MCLSVCPFVCMPVCVCVYVCVYVCVCLCVRMSVCLNRLNLLNRTSVRLYVCMCLLARHKCHTNSCMCILQLVKFIKEKNKAFRSWMTAKSNLHRDAARLNYTKLRNKAKTLLRKSRRLFEKGIAQRSKSNPKAFWSHTRRKLQTKCSVAPLLEDVKNKSYLRFKDKEKANILQKQFSSVFTKEPEGATPIIDKRTNSVLQDISIYRYGETTSIKIECKQIMRSR